MLRHLTNEMETLSDISKKNIYEVPKNYFDTLPDRVRSKIMQKSRYRKQQMYLFMLTRVAIPSLVIIGIVCFVTYTTFFSHDQDGNFVSTSVTKDLTYPDNENTKVGEFMKQSILFDDVSIYDNDDEPIYYNIENYTEIDEEEIMKIYLTN